MALQIKIETIFGVEATYHKLINIEFDFRINKGVARLHSFKDQTARLEKKIPLADITIDLVNMNEFDAQSIYEAIKQNEQFAKAKDV